MELILLKVNTNVYCCEKIQQQQKYSTLLQQSIYLFLYQIRLLTKMEQGEMQKYQEIAKLYKEIVDSITTLELPQLKLYLVNLEKRIQAKGEPLLEDYHSVKQLLDNTKEAKGKVPLHFACAKGDLVIVQYLVEQTKLDYRIKDKQGSNPYFTSVEHGHLNIIQYFIEEGKISANETKEGEISALHIAANHNHTEIITYLISKGGDVEKISIYGKPINWAVGGRNFQATKLLLDNGANPDGDNSGTNISPLILAVDHKDHQIYKILVQRGANINTKDPNGYTVLHLAAEKGDLQIVKDLVNKGADINIQAQGKTALYLAFQHSKWQVVSFLKQKTPNYHQIQQKWKGQSEKLKQSIVQPNKQRAQEIKIIGNKFYAAKQYEQALAEYHKAIVYDQQNEVIHRNIAACYLALKNYELALFHCKQAKKKDPKNVKTTYREAQAYMGLGNLIDASSSMWECCLIQPKNQNFRAEFQQLVQKAKQQHNAQPKQ